VLKLQEVEEGELASAARALAFLAKGRINGRGKRRIGAPNVDGEEGVVVIGGGRGGSRVVGVILSLSLLVPPFLELVVWRTRHRNRRAELERRISMAVLRLLRLIFCRSVWHCRCSCSTKILSPPLFSSLSLLSVILCDAGPVTFSLPPLQDPKFEV